MIKHIELRNTRIFDDVSWNFDLPKLSIFCGTNSSGKSTILKSLLLLRQSMGIEEPLGPNYGKLRFVGNQVDLGNYKSFVSHEDLNREITIGLTIVDYFPVDFFKVLWQLNHEGESFPEPSDKKDKVYYNLEVKFVFCHGRQQSAIENKIPVTYDTTSTRVQGILKYAKFEVTVDNERFLEWDIFLGENRDNNEEKQKYFIRLPINFFTEQYNEVFPELFGDSTSKTQQLKKGKKSGTTIQIGLYDEDLSKFEKEKYIILRTFLQGLLPEYIGVHIRKGGEEKGVKNEDKNISKWRLPISPLMNYIQTDLMGALGLIEYLGPLRSPAKRYYLTAQDANPIMDATGEFLPYVFRDLKQGKEFKIDFCPPSDTTSEVCKDIPLADAINTWMHYIRTGEKLQNCERSEIDVEQTKVLLEFKIRSSLKEESHSLVDTGFGYSQLLPILIRGLMASPGSTIVIEQPELHLNPALQVRLTEFLLSLVRMDKQVLIETHSEHIVNMVRVIIAEDSSGELAKQSRIYYIDNESDHAIVHDLTIQPDGSIPKWPQSFFGEAATLAGRLLRAQKRFRTQNNK